MVVGSACATTHAPAFVTRPPCPLESSDHFYFPENILPDSFERQWYSKHLRAMKEPSLSCGVTGEREVYRVTVLPSFSNPVSVRVSRNGGHYTVRTIVLDGAGGYDPGNIMRERHRTISTDEWKRLKAAVEESDFWEESTDAPTRSDVVVVDGTQWIFEGSAKTYHVVVRHDTSMGAFDDLGELFAKLTQTNKAR